MLLETGKPRVWTLARCGHWPVNPTNPRTVTPRWNGLLQGPLSPQGDLECVNQALLVTHPQQGKSAGFAAISWTLLFTTYTSLVLPGSGSWVEALLLGSFQSVPHPRGSGGITGSRGQPRPLFALQVLRYFDYVFTGVFTFEMVIKVRTSRGLPQTFQRKEAQCV